MRILLFAAVIAAGTAINRIETSHGVLSSATATLHQPEGANLESTLRAQLSAASAEKVQAEITAANLDIEMKQLEMEVKALTASKKGLTAAISALSRQESAVMTEAAAAADDAKKLLQQRLELIGTRDASKGRVVEYDQRRNESMAAAVTLNSQNAALDAQIATAKAHVAAFLKVFEDEDSSQKQKLENFQSSLSSVQGDVERLRGQKAEMLKKVAALEGELASLETNRRALQAKVNELNRLKKSTESRVAVKTQAADQAEQTIDAARAELRKAEGETATLTATRRDLEVQLYTLREEQQRSVELKVAEQRAAVKRLGKDLDGLRAEAATIQARLTQLQISIAGLTDANTKQAQRVKELRTKVEGIKNSTSAIDATRISVDNSTMHLLLHASTIRDTAANITRVLREFQSAKLVAAAKARDAAANAAVDHFQNVGLTDSQQAAIDGALMMRFKEQGQDGSMDPRSESSDSRGIHDELLHDREHLLSAPHAFHPELEADLQSLNHLPRFRAMGDDFNVTTDSDSGVLETLRTQVNGINVAVTDLKSASNRRRSRVTVASSEKLSLAKSITELQQRFADLQERVQSLQQAYDNSTDAISAVREEVDELKFNTDLVAAEEKAAAERSKAAEDEVQKASDARKDKIAELGRISDEKLTKTEALKSSIRDKLAIRRQVAQKLATSQSQKVLLSAAVDEIKQKVEAMEGEKGDIVKAIADITAEKDRLERAFDVVMKELALQQSRIDRVKVELPVVVKRREDVLEMVRRQKSAITGLQSEILGVQNVVKDLKGQLDTLTAERTALNGAIASLKNKNAADTQAASAAAERIAQSQIESDRLTRTEQKLGETLQRSQSRFSEAIAALERARRRETRVLQNIEKLRDDISRSRDQLAAIDSKHPMLAVADKQLQLASPSASTIVSDASTNSTSTASSSSAAAAVTQLSEQLKARFAARARLSGLDEHEN